MPGLFPRALPHGPLVEILPDLFVVTGTFRLALGAIAFPRNMTILRHQGELTVFNSVRLTSDGEKALATLGEVRHVVRLGAFHGVDDAYYLDRYRPTFWLPDKTRLPARLGRSATHSLTHGMRPPFAPDCEVFLFQDTRLSEAVLRLPRGNGLLLVCDSVGNFRSTDGFSALARLLMPGGVAPCTVASSTWRRQMQKKGGPSLRADFERLLALEFDGLVPAHGDVMLTGAKDALSRSVAQLWNRQAVRA
jgi:hypothetical protein